MQMLYVRLSSTDSVKNEWLFPKNANQNALRVTIENEEHNSSNLEWDYCHWVPCVSKKWKLKKKKKTKKKITNKIGSWAKRDQTLILLFRY